MAACLLGGGWKNSLIFLNSLSVHHRRWQSELATKRSEVFLKHIQSHKFCKASPNFVETIFQAKVNWYTVSWLKYFSLEANQKKKGAVSWTKQARKSSEDAQAAEYARFAKVWARYDLGKKCFNSKYLHTCILAYFRTNFKKSYQGPKYIFFFLVKKSFWRQKSF